MVSLMSPPVFMNIMLVVVVDSDIVFSSSCAATSFRVIGCAPITTLLLFPVAEMAICELDLRSDLASLTEL
jgi:hypothetical protein